MIPIGLFGALLVVPLAPIIKSFNYIGFEEKDVLLKEYDDAFFGFKEDFERCNPITKNKGIMTYLEKLLEKNIISDDEFNQFREKINNKEEVNVVEIYNRKVKSGYRSFKGNL
jgi:hypothetical protein